MNLAIKYMFDAKYKIQVYSDKKCNFKTWVNKFYVQNIFLIYYSFNGTLNYTFKILKRGGQSIFSKFEFRELKYDKGCI